MRTIAIPCLALLAVAGLSAAAKPAKPPSDVPVTSIINAYDTGVAPALQIQPDGLGNYTDSKTQTSKILANGDWRLDDLFLSGATRMIVLNFTQPIAGTGPNGGAPVAPPSGAYIANFGANCQNMSTSMFAVPPGGTVQCPLEAAFNYNGQMYLLHMAPQNATFAETDPTNVTCIFPTSGSAPCSQWRLYPSGIVTNPDGTTRLANVANLSIETTVHGKTVYTKQGDFYFSYSIVVTNP